MDGLRIGRIRRSSRAHHLIAIAYFLNRPPMPFTIFVTAPKLAPSGVDLLAAAGSLATDLRATVTTPIAQTVKAWDDAQLVRQLELSVGRDLQFIRINGTIVGGLIGLLLHAVAVFG